MTTFHHTVQPNFDALSSKLRQRRPGPAQPKYGIPPAQWPDVLSRIEQGESLRQVAKDYNVSYQTIWRTLHAARKQGKGGK